MTYEKLLIEALHHDIDVFEKPMTKKNKGLYADNVIWINKYIPTNAEKGCVLAEELGHHHTSAGDILDQSKLINRKQEIRARNWAYEKLVPLPAFILAHKTGIRNRHELAEYLEVTEQFLDNAIKHYISKYGLLKTIDGLTICFEPLGVLEMFED